MKLSATEGQLSRTRDKMRSLVEVTRKQKPQPSSIVIKKYRLLRLRRRRSLRQEYQKLRSLLPGPLGAPQLSNKVLMKAGVRQVCVVDAAYQYICHLQSALLAKFSRKGIPTSLAGVVDGEVRTTGDVRTLALHLMLNTTLATAPPLTPAPLTPPSNPGPPDTAL